MQQLHQLHKDIPTLVKSVSTTTTVAHTEKTSLMVLVVLICMAFGQPRKKIGSAHLVLFIGTQHIGPKSFGLEQQSLDVVKPNVEQQPI